MFAQQTTTTTSTVNTEEEHTAVKIDALGRVNVEGQNYTGDACSILGDKFNQAFGGGGSKSDKPEAFQADAASVEETQHW